MQSIVANPGDEALWLILADWLEEHDDPRRAELLRLHRQLLATCCQPDQHPEREAWQSRLVELLTAGVRPSVPRRTVTLAEGVAVVFSFIPPGSFLMGSPGSEEGRASNEFQHEVTLTQGFWLASTPVTKVQWTAVINDNRNRLKKKDHPVNHVIRRQSQEFCLKLKDRDGKPYRLPSEAEWEYACRCGTTTPFFFGATLSHQQAAYECGKTVSVGSFPCNAWGLFDMHGNVWEQCQDLFGNYNKRSTRNPKGPKTGTTYVLRGGCWRNPWSYCRSASRYHMRRAGHGDGVGFRLACSLA